MRKSVNIGITLLPEHLAVVDQWCESTGMSRSEAFRLAIEELSNREIKKERFQWKFTEPRIVEESTK